MPEHNNSEQINLDQAVNEPHAYYRVFDAKTRNSITAIAEKISADSLVLDLGAGSGVLGEYLSTEKNCIVDGIDLNLQETKHSDCYRKIQSANLETQSLATLLSDQYDVIVCADLLEHLRSPQQLLVQLKDFVKADGSILLSVPNV
ncbi:MAG: methyltransferase domain-containing protein, partial [Methylococcales bacterium]